MSNLSFKHCRFVKSSAGADFPKDWVPHLALIGRSNVGKSSFINYLFRNRTLAKISATPGKTALVNFFLVDEKMYLVDLPGYGYAKRAKGEQEKWPRMVASYFQAFPDATLLHLLDARHEPSDEDWVFFEWASEMGKKPLFIFTKIDKIQRTTRDAVLKKLAASIGEDIEYIPMSIKEPGCRDAFMKVINEKWETLRKTPLSV